MIYIKPYELKYLLLTLGFYKGTQRGDLIFFSFSCEAKEKLNLRLFSREKQGFEWDQ